MCEEKLAVEKLNSIETNWDVVRNKLEFICFCVYQDYLSSEYKERCDAFNIIDKERNLVEVNIELSSLGICSLSYRIHSKRVYLFGEFDCMVLEWDTNVFLDNLKILYSKYTSKYISIPTEINKVVFSYQDESFEGLTSLNFELMMYIATSLNELPVSKLKNTGSDRYFAIHMQELSLIGLTKESCINAKLRPVFIIDSDVDLYRLYKMCLEFKGNLSIYLTDVSALDNNVNIYWVESILKYFCKNMCKKLEHKLRIIVAVKGVEAQTILRAVSLLRLLNVEIITI